MVNWAYFDYKNTKFKHYVYRKNIAIGGIYSYFLTCYLRRGLKTKAPYAIYPENLRCVSRVCFIKFIMEIIVKKHFLLPLFLVISAINTVSAASLIINGQDVNEHIKPGQTIIYEFESTHIAFKLQNGTLDIGSTELKNLESLEDHFKALEKNKHSLTQYNSGKHCNFRSGLSTSLKSTYMTVKVLYWVLALT